MDVSDLENPITFTIQLDDTSEDDHLYVKQCVYYDTNNREWKHNECSGKRLNSNTMLCCSDHMT